ncbi:hypothetical protein NG895_02150 [Aeoliella sp. ICT_H6.2]|uniref:Uncharacterized protein n=1 Tax=Aeoliella straminimaris TaxID=2954799 RepID=A0A9X2F6U5_9BACT|nr:hypothetical protein [Aeoliella straminimaris]MCO6042698.1 hypothetical protein [Aeoliella straminimaris]
MPHQNDDVARAKTHLSLNLSAALTAGALTYGWFVLGMNHKEWHEFAPITSITVFGGALMLLSTYHRSLNLHGFGRSLLHYPVAAIVVISWSLAGYMASAVCAEGLVFYGFLIPPLKHVTSGYLEQSSLRPDPVEW